jgi:hypothetical protein
VIVDQAADVAARLGQRHAYGVEESPRLLLAAEVLGKTLRQLTKQVREARAITLRAQPRQEDVELLMVPAELRALPVDDAASGEKATLSRRT